MDKQKSGNTGNDTTLINIVSNPTHATNEQGKEIIQGIISFENHKAGNPLQHNLNIDTIVALGGFYWGANNDKFVYGNDDNTNVSEHANNPNQFDNFLNGNNSPYLGTISIYYTPLDREK